MDQYSLIFAPFLGGLIGYVTNSIAVKMLFHPYKQIKLGKFVVPYTPGIIPKRQKDLAYAMGNMVEHHLITSDDFKLKLLSDKTKTSIVEGLSSKIFEITDKHTFKELIINAADEESYERLKCNLSSYLYDRIIIAITDINLAEIIAKEGSVLLRSAMGGLLSMMVSETTILNLSNTIEEKIKSYAADQGRELIIPILDDEIESITGKNSSDGILSYGFSQEKFQSTTIKIYESVITQNYKNIYESIGISNIVNDKIASMDVGELENLILSIMKKELEAIINLGAVIGFAIGLFAVFF